MEWTYGINPEDDTNYIVDLSELDNEIYSTYDLLEEIAVLVGDKNINEFEDGIYSIDLEYEELERELNSLCKSFDKIFKEEYKQSR